MRQVRILTALLFAFAMVAEVTAQVAMDPAFPALSFQRPIQMTPAPGFADRLFVVEQQGIIRTFTNSPSVDETTEFLNITDRVRTEHNEEGLLGLAFHPDFATNGEMYVYYSASDPRRSVVSRFTATTDPWDADEASEEVLLEVEQPFGNHNGGQIRFGPDGYLYIALGDGGDAGDPNENGQDRTTLLGSLLRIDVDQSGATTAYAIPEDNPFVGNDSAWREEIYAYGFRNPYRFSFDESNGWLWLSDVGQDAVEEIDVVTAGGNYGWNIMEGSGCFDPKQRCDGMARDLGLKMPIFDYTHRLGDVIIGGHVYHGSAVTGLSEKYLFADFSSGRIWALEFSTADTSLVRADVIATAQFPLSAFGRDGHGESYLLGFDGRIYSINGSFSPEPRLSIESEAVFPDLQFNRPVDMIPAPGGDALFVVEQPGRIVRIADPESAPTASTFLDIRQRVRTEHNEEGLLGLAFHPDFASNGKFYVYYSASSPRRSVISEFMAPSGTSADPSSERVLMEVEQPFGNHNGGQIRFGPDGYLYIALGDGGDAGDPGENGQDRTTLLGSLLRIDVDSRSGDLAYGIPADNPFVENDSAWREEIYAFGFRNPYRFSFDNPTGRLWLADVGQDKIEEINLVESGSNYGWNIMEGSGCFDPRQRCDGMARDLGLTMPVFDYTHRLGDVVLGGYVYRGSNLPELVGKYLFGDFSAGTIWSLEYSDVDSSVDVEPIMSVDYGFGSFGIDASGELYLLGFDGTVYRIGLDESSVSSKRSARMLQVRPNPIGDRAVIVLPEMVEGTAEISVYDATGKLVDRLNGTGATAWEPGQSSGTRLPAGSYFLEVRDEQGLVAARKVIVQ